jgi:dCMP deaminase
MSWAFSAAERSHALRRKVGCVIVQNDSVISYGYNGTPAGLDNACEQSVLVRENDQLVFRLKTKPLVSHAEMNAIGKLAESGMSARGATLYCTDSPCLECAKLIQRTGIIEMVYTYTYSNTEGIQLLQDRGIIIRRIDGR